MIVPNKFNGYNRDGTRNLFMGGGGGPTQTTSTVQNTNVPEYARPYVENMLGATQQQLFQGSRGPDVTNPETGEVVRQLPTEELIRIAKSFEQLNAALVHQRA